ncbi:type III-B CRISPR module RAMP protein Cmr1 [Tindallia californiensis]|uniref:CRISPR type III-B/RAMP module RAMP protein Cmr1 n=1 Tax=Tindallia californiensis TaxID=159292 RepID=A0A1H3PQ23_9FIRM|nr:type III-B CRISPR module RAMP protein Cmr1 [Tindallia californiensis]SDZ03136.1 CRISPR type III-B/RAMP module RAMP protein Cmr1 [Tindallia californiensis]
MNILEDLKQASSMISKTYELELLTPLMLHGFQQQFGKKHKPKYAELREPSVKGIIRYWWRAMQYEEDLKNIIKRETDLFGGTGMGDKQDGRSSRIKIKWLKPERQTAEARVCPHKGEKPSTTAIEASARNYHKIQMSCYRCDEEKFQEAEPYIRLTWMLAGFGQRARRGAGALQLRKITERNEQEIKWENTEAFRTALFTVLGELNKDKYFSKGSNPTHLIQWKHKESDLKGIMHPVLHNVWVGKGFENSENVRNRISTAGHIANSGNGNLQYLGKAMGGREASPLHATVRRFGNQHYPLISEVAKEEKRGTEYLEARNAFLSYLGVRV